MGVGVQLWSRPGGLREELRYEILIHGARKREASWLEKLRTLGSVWITDSKSRDGCNSCSFSHEYTQVEIPILSLLGICTEAKKVNFVLFLASPTPPTAKWVHFRGKVPSESCGYCTRIDWWLSGEHIGIFSFQEAGGWQVGDLLSQTRKLNFM